jgi:hypothetical protein
MRNLLKRLSSHKAYGVDHVAYEALKMCQKSIAEHLVRIFNACIHLRLHPDRFKDIITIILRKPGKPADRPNSYRPIALLNTLGKVYERIIADRIKDIVIRHKDMLPDTQFGASGRSTTLALERLNHVIYEGWTSKKKVSLLGLDILGAYDHIDRTKLLQALISKGLPDWPI